MPRSERRPLVRNPGSPTGEYDRALRQFSVGSGVEVKSDRGFVLGQLAELEQSNYIVGS